MTMTEKQNACPLLKYIVAGAKVHNELTWTILFIFFSEFTYFLFAKYTLILFVLILTKFGPNNKERPAKIAAETRPFILKYIV